MPTNRGLIDRAVDQCVRTILYDSRIATVTKYVTESLTVKVTRRLYGKKRRPSLTRSEFVVTAGRPNYAERAFIRKLGKAGEPFPVKKVQVKWRKSLG